MVQLYEGRYAVPEHAALRSLSCQARQAAAGAAAGARDVLLALLSLALELALDNLAVTALLLATAGVAGAYHVRERARAITAALADAMVESVHEAAAAAGANVGIGFPVRQLEGKVVGDLSARLVASAARLRELLGAAREAVLASGRLQLQVDQGGTQYWVLPQLQLQPAVMMMGQAPGAAGPGFAQPAAVAVPLPPHNGYGGGHNNNGGGGNGGHAAAYAHAPPGAAAGAAAGAGHRAGPAGPAAPPGSARFAATPVAQAAGTPARAGTPAAYAVAAPAAPGLLYGTPPAVNPQAVHAMPASGARAAAATGAGADVPFYGRPVAMAAVPAQPYPVFGAGPQLVQPSAPPAMAAMMPGYYAWGQPAQGYAPGM